MSECEQGRYRRTTEACAQFQGNTKTDYLSPLDGAALQHNHLSSCWHFGTAPNFGFFFVPSTSSELRMEVKVIGILGGGQLGRMMAIAAHNLGTVKVRVLVGRLRQRCFYHAHIGHHFSTNPHFPPTHSVSPVDRLDALYFYITTNITGRI